MNVRDIYVRAYAMLQEGSRTKNRKEKAGQVAAAVWGETRVTRGEDKRCGVEEPTMDRAEPAVQAHCSLAPHHCD